MVLDHEAEHRSRSTAIFSIAVIDRGWRTVLGRAITPAAAALENMHNPTDDPPIINPRNPTNIGR
jgi:hypothetical protein